MLQPSEPVIVALRQELVELKGVLKEIQDNMAAMNSSIQDAFEGMARGTGMSLRVLDARIDDLETRVSILEPLSLQDVVDSRIQEQLALASSK